MTIRAFSIGLLAFTALVVTAILMAMGVSVARWFGWPTGVWMAPSLLFGCTTLLFFLARHHILPADLAATSGRAFSVITAWNGIALGLSGVALLIVRRVEAIAPVAGLLVLIVWVVSIVALGPFLAQRLFRQRRLS